MREIYECPKTGRYKWREKQPASEPPVLLRRRVRCAALSALVSAVVSMALGSILVLCAAWTWDAAIATALGTAFGIGLGQMITKRI